MKRAPQTKSTPINSLKHADHRANIPTEELRDFVADEERYPKTALYPRDPSLDPQLVWKGKDEQDQHPLEVPAVPIYIQEKIQPQAIVEQVRSENARFSSHSRSGGEGGFQFSLFADFTGADEPNEKLKRAPRAEIDEAAWSALYATTSYPFEKPQTGKIAVKVINHYGDEVMKVFPV